VPMLKGLMFKPGPLTDFSQTLAIIAQARDAVASWGGKLVVVLIPTYEEVVAKQIPADRSNERIMGLLNPLGVHVINGVALFRTQPDPAALYNLRSNNHLNAAGHRLFGAAIAADLASHYPELATASQ
jgi:GGDEF domain-containing protein